MSSPISSIDAFQSGTLTIRRFMMSSSPAWLTPGDYTAIPSPLSPCDGGRHFRLHRTATGLSRGLGCSIWRLDDAGISDVDCDVPLSEVPSHPAPGRFSQRPSQGHRSTVMWTFVWT